MLIRGRQLIGRTKQLFWHVRQSIGELSPVDQSRDSYQSLADEINGLLHENLLTVWYPHSLDRRYGGYYQRLSLDWSGKGETNKFLVCQARLAWTAAAAAGHAGELRESYLACARHGLKFLDEVMRDKRFGGFHWRLDRSGRLTDRFGDDKHVYGIAFVVYAAAEIFRHTQEDRDLQVAVDASSGWNVTRLTTTTVATLSGCVEMVAIFPHLAVPAETRACIRSMRWSDINQ